MVSDFGALGFWIFLAALIVGGMWKESRQNAEKHETLRRIMEKTGEIDEAKLKELFSPEPDEETKPGGGYRALRITGTIIMFVAAGLAVIFLTAGLVFGHREAFAALAIALGAVVAGLGVFFSSRFAEPPPGAMHDRKPL
jgi:hypothetical protein